MNIESKRIEGVRLLVLVSVNLKDEQFIEQLHEQRPASVADVVAAEVTSNLESVSYIEVAIAVQL